MWKQISEELKAAVAAASPRLVHVGGSGIPGRTGLVWAQDLVVTLARQARSGESVPVVLADGSPAAATVQAWDPRTGLALLKVPGLPAPGWTVAGAPPVGTLVLTVAFPSPQGPEARLDLVRYSGGPSEWGPGVGLEALFQTDGNPWPGFTGAAVVDSEGAFVGLVAENRSGNGGFVVPGPDLARLVEVLLKDGSPQRAWLGVSTRPGGGQGLSLVGVDEASPAWTAGWRSGDLLISLAGRPLQEPSDLVSVLAHLVPGTEVEARLLRQGEVFRWPVTPAAR